MKDTFEKQVSNSLLRLHRRLKMSVVWHASHLKEVKANLDFLKEVAENPFKYCLTDESFNKNMESLGFYTAKRFSLFGLNKRAAQCVHDIMICVHDYMCYDNQSNRNRKGYKYMSKDAVVIAMRLFERDSIILGGGFVVDYAHNLWNFVFNQTR